MQTVFESWKFVLLIAGSIGVPIGIYALLLRRRAVSRWTVLLLGLALVAVAGADVFVLKYLASAARDTASALDDTIFASEMSLALYLFPALFGGVGVSLVSHVLIQHLQDAETRFDREHGRSR